MADLSGWLAEALAGQYVIERELTRTGLLITYQARQVERDRVLRLVVLRPEVAIAVPSAHAQRVFDGIQALTHPNIVPMVDAGATRGLVYYATPLLEGEWLRERIKASERLGLEVVLRIGRDVASALSYCHDHRILHAVTPDNVLLTGPRTLLCDVGILDVLAVQSDRLTASGMIIGSPSYMSPEEASGQGRDARSDVYALGCTLFEMLAGEPPFTGLSAQQILARKLSSKPDLKAVQPKLPKQVRRALEHALERVPAHRYQTALDFLEALAALLSAMHEGTPPATEHDVRPGGSRPAARREAIPGLTSRYEVVQEIGRGGMAVVYLAVDRQFQRRVAIKVMLREQLAAVDVKRFLREIAVTAQLSHPHIVPMIEAGMASRVPYFVMPFVEGGSLRQRMARAPLSTRDALTLAAIVADTLYFAHSNGIIHRDIKPENILLHQGFPMIADFGIAMSLRSSTNERLTRPGYWRGSPPYCSPEQVAAEPALDPRTDIYSLGVVLYEMVKGEVPLADEPLNPATAVEEVLQKALARKRDDRFATAAAFRDALKAAKKTTERE